MKLTKNDQFTQQEQQMLYNKKYAFFTLQNEQYVQIVCELPNIFTVEDTINFIIKQFRSELGLNLQQQKGIDYVLKISKKSGVPKDDLPKLDNEQILVETGCSTFTLVCKKSITSSETQQQPQTSVTTTMTSQPDQQDMSIKSRVSYTNGLTKGKKPIKESDSKEKSGGFCFFNKCF